MKKILGALVVFAAVSFAAPTCAPPYLNVVTSPGAAGCMAGGLTFQNFAVSSNPLGMTVELSGVTVVTTPAPAVDLAFTVTGFSFPGGTAADLRLSYEVVGTTTGIDNSFAGGPGTSILETVCDSSGITGGACNGKVIAQLTDTSALSPISVSFGKAYGDVWIIKDITASASATGTVEVSDFTNSHETATPEPTTLSLMGLGLVGLGLITRRRKV